MPPCWPPINTRILVDAGLSMKELGRRLASIGEDLEHARRHPHHPRAFRPRVRSAGAGAQQEGARRHLHDAAHRAGHRLGRNRAAPGDVSGRRRLRRSATSKWRASASRTTPSTRWASASRREGVRIGVATDLGYIPESVKFHLRRTDLLLLEANHDLDMLKVGPYPWSVKQRVMSRVGHLSNLVMSDFLLRRSGFLDRAPGAGPPERAEQPPGDRAADRHAGAGAARPAARGSPSPPAHALRKCFNSESP